MTYKRRLLAFVSLLMVSLAALAFTPNAAQARPSSCNYNDSVCGFEDANWSCNDGCEIIPVTRSGCIEPQIAMNDQWSSFWNNSGRVVRVWTAANCTGSYLTFYSGQGEAYFLVTHSAFENTISSVSAV